MTKRKKRTPHHVSRLRRRAEKRPVSKGLQPREGKSDEISKTASWHVIAVWDGQERNVAIRATCARQPGRSIPADPDPDSCLLFGDGIDVYSPTDNIEVQFKGATLIRHEATFLGYVFVGVQPGVSLFERVANLPSVLEAVGGWINPRKVDGRDLRALERWLTGEQRRIRLPTYAFKQGQLVRITEGPFMGHFAKVDYPDAEKINRLLVKIFGRDTIVQVEPGQFEAA